jgi:hypothetical protein
MSDTETATQTPATDRAPDVERDRAPDVADADKTPPVQNPTVGRVVHYRPRPSDFLDKDRAQKGQPFPAVVTHVWGDTTVNLSIGQDGTFPLLANALIQTSVTLGDGEGEWSWPPRV